MPATDPLSPQSEVAKPPFGWGSGEIAGLARSHQVRALTKVRSANVAQPFLAVPWSLDILKTEGSPDLTVSEFT
jgi:hypothetical protein